jgi:hypothetical protein
LPTEVPIRSFLVWLSLDPSPVPGVQSAAHDGDRKPAGPETTESSSVENSLPQSIKDSPFL